ncbi:hypothetical protein LASUN_13400 [Lentilactobacillus sunkii]|jgi:hypothetical protein|uniref:Uncharacterized protein n=1 Tax=Lentilactobacillus sunkii TaxID=481719 RepID=A0A1E7XCD8_9LACO|nr:hypothetical protein LASUN_13400 [Lentilactobacillus sunkii]
MGLRSIFSRLKQTSKRFKANKKTALSGNSELSKLSISENIFQYNSSASAHRLQARNGGHQL